MERDSGYRGVTRLSVNMNEPKPGHERVWRSRPRRFAGLGRPVSADLIARGIPGTLPAVDHAAGPIQLADIV